MAKICLNMIVKNEAANLLRCLTSLVPYVSSYCITDTGSTDDTPNIIREFFGSRNIPGELHHDTFVNFGQSRNAALKTARESALDFDYLLLTDADMELLVAPNFAPFSRLTLPAYNMLQRNGELAYWNVRLLRRDSPAQYVGVTHEFLSVDHQGQIEGAWFVDHATGSNRPDKCERDIRLLSAEVERNPRDVRSWFYLANSYRDIGRTLDAAEAYEERIKLGGWDEEVYCARLYLARCYRDMKDEGAFIRNALAAHNSRHSRAESLHDLARYFREKGENYTALLFAEAGGVIPMPNDVLFLETYPYHAGFREEFSICAFYNDAKKKDGFQVCNDLALDPTIPEGTRHLARSNLYHYLPKLVELAPSFEATQVEIELPSLYSSMNPSITAIGDQLVMNVRAVNYRITDTGQYDMQGDTAIRTRNFLVRLDPDLNVLEGSVKEIKSPFTHAFYDQVLGWEDVRLFAWQGKLWVSANVREQNQDGWCEQWRAQIHENPDGAMLVRERAMYPPWRATEKNWMPRVDCDGLTFVYDAYTIVDDEGKPVHKFVPNMAVEQFRGGSQAIPFDGGWLALIHEAGQRAGYGDRFYQHRFVWYSHDDKLEKVSLPFVFHDRQIEFAAGIVRHPLTGDILFSYGVRDRESWVGMINPNEVRNLLWSV